jgi:DNA ligase-1
LVQLFYGCSPVAAKFLVRALIGDLRIGLRDGLLEAAIAAAFDADLAAVRWAMLLEGDPGRVALLARSGRLHEARLQLFHPIPPMLAAATSGVPEVVERLSERPEFAGRPEFTVAVEDKYDGVRAQLHVDGERAALYGRDLHDVTVSFPEITAAARAAGISGIFDGEIVAWEDGRPLPSSTSVDVRLKSCGSSRSATGRFGSQPVCRRKGPRRSRLHSSTRDSVGVRDSL